MNYKNKLGNSDLISSEKSSFASNNSRIRSHSLPNKFVSAIHTIQSINHDNNSEIRNK